GGFGAGAGRADAHVAPRVHPQPFHVVRPEHQGLVIGGAQEIAGGVGPCVARELPTRVPAAAHRLAGHAAIGVDGPDRRTCR
ncbi:hypothetical protein OFC56_38600, partial [Escherichia coli]|nr:hypothetical protein [Escherichia coli]